MPTETSELQADTPPAAQRRTKVRLARFDDYAQIAQVLERNGLRAKSREEWEHLWAGNPVFQNRPDFPMGWVAQNEHEQIVGYLGNIPLQYKFRGQVVRAAAPAHFSMDVPYRGSAGFLMRRMLAQRTSDFMLVTTVNENSVHLNQAFRQYLAPVGNWERSCYWITDYAGFAASACRRKEISTIAQYPGATLLAAQDQWTGGNNWLRQEHREVEECMGFDERFEEFWRELQIAHPNRMLADRSLSHLQWHFKYALARGRVWIAAITEHSRILAYAVFLRQDNPGIELRRLRLVDFQCLTESADLLRPILLWALQRCRREGLHTLESFACRPEKQAALDSLKPRYRKLPAWMYFYMPCNPEMKEVLSDTSVWDPSQYDGDGSL